MPDTPNDPGRTPPHEPVTLTTPADPDGTLAGPPPTARLAPHDLPAEVAPPPGYEILGELGRGGMGAVYKARQVNLNRTVALKVVLGGGRVAVARFWAEAEVVAAVRHPNVVGVYEFGEHAGRPHMAMEFCPGGSLAERPKPLPPHEAAALVEKVARGVAAAHAEGIVHRDLKPGNVLFDAAGEPKVADFGLAKRVAVDLTNTDAVLGTPAYMAPEQAEGRTKFAGPPADVWALGVILHELVTGTRPFDGDSAQAIMLRIITADPPSLRTLVRTVPRDLETVVAKCLAKEPDLRYATAADLADDLARFGRGEPVAARRAGTVERAARWARRNPTAATAWALGLTVLAVGTFATSTATLWRQAEEARGKAVEALTGERVAKGKAEVAEATERRLKQQVAFLNYAHTVDLAYREYQANNPARGRELLASCPPEYRHWEWDYVHRLCHSDRTTFAGHTGLVTSASFSPDGSRVVTGAYDRTARVWDARTGNELLALRGHADIVRIVSFSPDGRRVVTVSDDGTARVWDARTGGELTSFEGHTDCILSASFSPDGSRVLTGSGDFTARVWDAHTGKELLALKGHTDRVLAASFSPDGRRVLTGSGDFTARLWDARTGKELAALRGHNSAVQPVSFSPDGRRVVTASYGIARVWETESGKQLSLFQRHTDGISSASFSPDGLRVATGSRDRTARVWDADSGTETALLLGHAGSVWATFSPDGQRVRTTSTDHTARVWDAHSGKELLGLAVHTGGEAMSFGPDGRQMVTVSQGWDHTARVWDAPGEREPAILGSRSGFIPRLSFGPDGRRVAVDDGGSRVRVVEAGTGKEWAVLATSVFSASFSPDGRRVVTGSGDFTARVWDAHTGKELTTLRGHTGNLCSASFSPDGLRVVTASDDLTARVWDACTGKELAAFRGHAGKVHAASFSPDGQRVVTGAGTTPPPPDFIFAPPPVRTPRVRPVFEPEDCTARVWDATTGKELVVLAGHAREVTSAAFSPDGRRVLTQSGDSTTRMWDSATGRELVAPSGHSGRVTRASFSPDGRRVVTVMADAVRVCDADTGKLIITLPHRGSALQAEFSPDGTRILVAHTTGDFLSGGAQMHVFDSAPVNYNFRRIAPLPRPKP